MVNNFSIEIAKKEIEKAIINELCNKNILDFVQYNNIIKKLNDDITKLENKIDNSEQLINIEVEIPI